MNAFLKSAAFALGLTFAAGAASATNYWVDYGVTLNARSGPGTNYHVIGTFSSCSKVNVVGYSHGWAKIQYNHSYYWVSAKYLQDHACNTGYAPKKKGGGYGNNY
ncbi:SH3 domain-containing protein [Tropicibacter sp. S64]|uniref:SH3 domain-containing protein n=1 Tax=Tropicibacter sp. S64 TaxID=3415122 RepID=UPI003C7A9C44